MIVLKMSTLSAAVAALALGQFAQAGLVISDNFTTGADFNNSRSPNVVNLPGSTYLPNFAAQSNSGLSTDGVAGQVATLWNGSGVAISIATAGGYTKASTITISDTFSLRTNAYTSVSNALGFEPVIADVSIPASSPSSSFVGLVVGQSFDDGFGTVRLFANGVTSNPQPAAFQFRAGAYGYDSGNYATLTYTIDTTSGSIQAASMTYLDDQSISHTQTYDFSAASLGLFTDSATNYAVINEVRTGGGQPLLVKSFSVSAVPEPASLALLGLLGCGGVGVMARRRQRA